MISVILAVLALVGSSFAVPAALAAPLDPGTTNITSVAPDEFPGLVEVVDKKKKRKQSRRYRAFIPGHVPTPYGYRDCIGRWHWHSTGWPHCHGQLIRDD
jgi:hypothetical protein